MQLSNVFIKHLQKLLGKEQVKTDEASLSLNGYDCSASQHRPDVVLTVTQVAQLPPLVKTLAEKNIPFIARAAATNHAGSCSAVRGGAVLNLNPLCHIYRIDTAHQWAEVEPACVTGDLQRELKPLSFFYAPDPASERVSTLGGNLSQNASGARCMKYGNTADNTLQAHVITPDGKLHSLRHDNPGPDWLGLFAGSEGTLGICTGLRVQILPIPSHIKTFLVTFPSLEESIQTVSDLVAHGLIPRCVEAMDHLTIQTVEQFSHAGYPEAASLLILELDGPLARIKQEADLLEKICRAHHCTTFQSARTEAERQKIWRGRRAAYAAMAALAPNVAVGDGTVPRSELARALTQVRHIIDKYQVKASLLFHAGDGNFHPQLVFNAQNPEQTRLVQKALHEILKTCVDCGGTVSGEHGIGVEKRAVMAYQYSQQTLRLFQKIKRAFDPKGLANPAKIIPVGFEEKAEIYQEKNPAVLTLQQEIQARAATKTPSVIVGLQSQILALKHAPLSTCTLTEIIEIDTTNYTATVQAGCRVQDVLVALSKHNAYAKLPKNYPGTIGGLVASKAVLPFVSQVIGIQAILPNGEIVNYGGKIMKNAAGYNVCRLLTGSWGSFGLITQITFKIYATPQPISWIKMPAPSLMQDPLFCAVKKSIDPAHLFQSIVLQEDAK